MNEKFNKNAKVEKFTTMLGIAVRLIVIEPLCQVYSNSVQRFLRRSRLKTYDNQTNANLVENFEYLLPINFCQTLFSGCK